MLQTRAGKRTGAAALRMAVEMTKGRKWKITREEAIQRITEDHLEQMLHPDFSRSPTADELITHGLAASPGAAVGRVYFTADDAAAADRGEKRDPGPERDLAEDVHGMIVAEGILTARGGLVSHAAVALGLGEAGGGRGRGDPHRAGRFVWRRRRRARGRDDLHLRFVGFVARGEIPVKARRPRPTRDDPRLGRRRPQGRDGRSGQRRQRPRCGQRPPVRRRGHRTCRTEHMFLGEDRLPIVRRMILADTRARRPPRSRS